MKSVFTEDTKRALDKIRKFNWQIIDGKIRVRGVDGEGNPGMLCPLGAIRALETRRVEFTAGFDFGAAWWLANIDSVQQDYISNAADTQNHENRPELMQLLEME